HRYRKSLEPAAPCLWRMLEQRGRVLRHAPTSHLEVKGIGRCTTSAAYGGDHGSFPPRSAPLHQVRAIVRLGRAGCARVRDLDCPAIRGLSSTEDDSAGGCGVDWGARRGLDVNALMGPPGTRAAEP